MNKPFLSLPCYFCNDPENRVELRAGPMEGKSSSSPSSSSSSSPSMVDELFKRKDAKVSASRARSSSSGYFSTLIPPASAVISKDLSHSDLCWTLNKQRADARIDLSKKRSTQNRDAKPLSSSDSIESPYFGSSLHYGGREFYSISSSAQTSGALDTYIADHGSSSGNPHAADRGEWWQGSLYY